jgi:HPr Serine kinase C-terminal domain
MRDKFDPRTSDRIAPPEFVDLRVPLTLRCSRPVDAEMDRGGNADTSIHASAVRTGDRAVLIRGPSGAGKSRLAFDLILAGRAGQIAETVLVGDDRVHLDVRSGRLMVRPADVLEGLIEIRGLGIRRCASLILLLRTPSGFRHRRLCRSRFSVWNYRASPSRRASHHSRL